MLRMREGELGVAKRQRQSSLELDEK
uniref:Uncharacterized protein n=1 Tax=Arundo donax TaxID=35708 RepID=A0A0A9A5K3_ARUDO